MLSSFLFRYKVSCQLHCMLKDTHVWIRYLNQPHVSCSQCGPGVITVRLSTVIYDNVAAEMWLIWMMNIACWVFLNKTNHLNMCFWVMYIIYCATGSWRQWTGMSPLSWCQWEWFHLKHLHPIWCRAQRRKHVDLAFHFLLSVLSSFPWRWNEISCFFLWWRKTYWHRNDSNNSRKETRKYHKNRIMQNNQESFIFKWLNIIIIQWEC